MGTGFACRDSNPKEADSQATLTLISNTRIMVFKGMVFKSKYWIWEKIKGVSVSNSSISKGIF